MSDWMWTWCGICFGYREQNSLWTYDGRHVGQFYGARVHAADGRYLGELWRGRLIVYPEHRLSRECGFVPAARRPPRERYTGFQGPPIPYGLEDFPPPEGV
jgi:hypothetical protein